MIILKSSYTDKLFKDTHFENDLIEIPDLQILSELEEMNRGQLIIDDVSFMPPDWVLDLVDKSHGIILTQGQRQYPSHLKTISIFQKKHLVLQEAIGKNFKIIPVVLPMKPLSKDVYHDIFRILRGSSQLDLIQIEDALMIDLIPHNTLINAPTSERLWSIFSTDDRLENHHDIVNALETHTLNNHSFLYLNLKTSLKEYVQLEFGDYMHLLRRYQCHKDCIILLYDVRHPNELALLQEARDFFVLDQHMTLKKLTFNQWIEGVDY